jgi:hypothetical protein
MRTGDTVTGGGRAWTLGQHIGDGLWGVTWEAFDPEGKRWVVKLPREAADLPRDVPLPPDLDQRFAKASMEATQALSGTHAAAAPRVEAVLDLPGGRSGVVMPRYDTLRARLDGAVGLRDAVGVLLRVAALLEQTKLTHGNLRPSNILLDERGQPHLMDVMTPAVQALEPIVGPLLQDRGSYAPPEGGVGGGADAWALCQALYEAVLAGEGRGAVPAPRGGLDKIALATVRDRALARLGGTSANPRFAPRFSERLASLLNRGLSAEREPSPPYRFGTARELGQRLEEVAALANPRVTHVGRLLLSPDAKQGVFPGGASVRFSVSVDCTSGVGVEDVVCGVKVVDLDAEGEGRVALSDTDVNSRPHPSGRLRFDLGLPDLPPGRYEATVAFGVKDGSASPTASTGRFEVRPPPGYVPPALDPPSAAEALSFPTEQVVATEPGTFADPVTEPSDAGDPSSIGMSRVVPLGVGPQPAHRPWEASDDPSSASEPGDDLPMPLAPSSPGIAPPEPREPTPMPLQPDIGASLAADDAGMPTVRDGSDREVLASSPTVPNAPAPTPPPAPPAAEPLRLSASFDDVPSPQRGTDLGDDLPTFDDDLGPPNGATAWVEKAIEFVRRDTYTAFMVVVVVALTALLVAIVSAKACAP